MGGGGARLDPSASPPHQELEGVGEKNRAWRGLQEGGRTPLPESAGTPVPLLS